MTEPKPIQKSLKKIILSTMLAMNLNLSSCANDVNVDLPFPLGKAESSIKNQNILPKDSTALIRANSIPNYEQENQTRYDIFEHNNSKKKKQKDYTSLINPQDYEMFSNQRYDYQK